ncbi:hypothetical protein RRG08_022112 [Elysia crispata]|uniref:Uncharacterized protein n=1 Tax=Elysia crispata TaxID=231223 RepID=A0AAE0XZZ0_9GAST|nr:hypothetical protein RRG08_022112 [Elysia crispata]
MTDGEGRFSSQESPHRGTSQKAGSRYEKAHISAHLRKQVLVTRKPTYRLVAKGRFSSRESPHIGASQKAGSRYEKGHIIVGASQKAEGRFLHEKAHIEAHIRRQVLVTRKPTYRCISEGRFSSRESSHIDRSQKAGSRHEKAHIEAHLRR